MAKSIFLLVLFSICSFGNPIDSILLTQSLALRFNTTIKTSIENQPSYLLQYFVPESWAQVQGDTQVLKPWEYLLVDKKHPGYMRVLIHPFDHVSSKKIEKVLQDLNLPSRPSRFTEPFFLTESRSLYPTRIIPGVPPVSPRLSMAAGFGKWGGQSKDESFLSFDNFSETKYNKLISSAQAEFALQASQIIQQKIGGTEGASFFIQPDRMILSIKSPDGSLDIGETFRDISSGANSVEFKLPGFITQDLRAGLLLALANGKSTLYQYLSEVEAPLRGTGLAEFFVKTGFVHSSPHSQNFLTSTDVEFQVGNKLGIRDLADLIPTVDSRLDEPKMARLFENFEDARVALREERDGGVEFFKFRHSFFKGGEDQRILSEDQKKEIEKRVSDAFVIELSRLTGVSIQQLISIVSFQLKSAQGDYATTSFRRDTDVWRQVQEGIRKYRQNSNSFNDPSSVVNRKITKSALEEPFKSAVIKKLKGVLLTAAEKEVLVTAWRQSDSNSKTTHLVALGVFPDGQIGKLYSQIDSPEIQKLFFKNLNQESSSDQKIEFLNYLQRIGSRLQSSKNYFLRVELEENVQEMVRTLAHNIKHQPRSVDLFQALYFAKKAVSEVATHSKYKEMFAYRFLYMATNLGVIPASVKNDLMAWAKTNEKSDVIESLLSLPSQGLSLCGQLY